MELYDRATPQENRLFARRLGCWMVAVVLAAFCAALVLNRFAPNRPVERESDLEHFYYGSIGSDISGGLPVDILLVLPGLFPEYLPPGAPQDLTAFGFLQQPGERLPIGLSVRRQLIDRTAINCGSCHTGIVRESPGAAPMLLPGAPANTVDLHSFFAFLFDVAADERFTAETVTQAQREAGIDPPLGGLLNRFIVPRMREALLERRERNAFLFKPEYPRFGPGRVNTFDTFKVDQFAPFYEAHGIALKPEEMFGNVDFPAVWNQRPREGLALHWDGNQTSVRERNFSAAIGAGARPEDMDVESLFRVEDWLRDLPPPVYPFPIDADLAAEGEPIYTAYCRDCHSFEGKRIATVMPLDEIGTDPYRNFSYTQVLLEAQKDYTKGYFWEFRNFSVTDGYTSQPLDGIWARAPYLHNGAVPSMRDLLSPEADRPVAFELGIDVYDQERMGYAAARLVPAGQSFETPDDTPYEGGHFVLDTRLKGNCNQGHSGPEFGTDLGAAEKRALIEYLKTL
jgi:hypothetical protein